MFLGLHNFFSEHNDLSVTSILKIQAWVIPGELT